MYIYNRAVCITLKVHVGAHDVFPPVREREVIRSIVVPVDEEPSEVLTGESAQQVPKSPKTRFVAVSCQDVNIS